MKNFKKLALASVLCTGVCLTVGGQKPAPAIPSDPVIEAHIQEWLKKMTLEEKIGQMCEITIDVVSDFEASKKNVVNRLARAIGHLEKVKRMVEDDCDCAEVLIQIAAVRAAIENTGKVILQDHIQHCIVDAVEEGDDQAIASLCAAIDKFMK